MTEGRNGQPSFKPRRLTLLRCNKTRNLWELKSTVPTITLGGRWMYEAGFRSGQKVEITVEDQKLILQVCD
ncbi:MAG: type I toxin-antitoxin system SymE family toxin [Tannerellaceae bacterium]|nr:type I toxin-antitoxin system SymE family toxin [Tannerellaceae bacterium]